MRYHSSLTGKQYTLTIVVRPYVDPDTEVVSPYWSAVEGMINGQGVLLDQPVWQENVSHACWSMQSALERYLEGKHHASHYTAFPEIAQALAQAQAR